MSKELQFLKESGWTKEADFEGKEILPIMEALLKRYAARTAEQQRRNCLMAWEGVGKKPFTRYGSKDIQQAILNADAP